MSKRLTDQNALQRLGVPEAGVSRLIDDEQLAIIEDLIVLIL